MKAIFLLLLFCAALSATAQSAIWGNSEPQPCGTWQAQPEEITDWHTVDTLGKKQAFPPERHWLAGTWKDAPLRGFLNAIWAPCGRGEPNILEQYRICSLTGIRQMRQRITAYKYIPAPLNEYERVRDSFYRLQDSTWSLPGGLFLHNGPNYIYRVDTTTIKISIPKKKKK